MVAVNGFTVDFVLYVVGGRVWSRKREGLLEGERGAGRVRCWYSSSSMYVRMYVFEIYFFV